MAWQGREYQGGYYSPPRMTPAVKAILLATVAVFVAEVILGRPFLEIFGLVPGLALGRLCVWQFVTYLFLHDTYDLFHILFNMLALYFFGPTVERILGSKRFVWFYIGSGAFAGLVHSAIGIFYSPGVPVVGASGALYAILVFCAMYNPNQIVILFIFPMKLRNLVLLLIGVNLFVTLRVGMGGMTATVAHLGGAAFGFAYYMLKVQRGFSLGGHLSGGVNRWINALKRRAELRHRMRENDEDDRVEDLLEKISNEGMNSLTEAERKFLTDAARRRRDRKW
ncbi:MAG: rhomboid family intramembrane serine protease [Planctomycetes bacterium]|nr:rhomboid family intramembrane serine protease [Planctomycetota bacterium]